MPQIGWFELLLIILVAILVIGPKDFPTVLRKIGSWVGTIKRYFSEMQSGMNEITNLEDEDKENILINAEEIEKNSNQLLSYTNIIKKNTEEVKSNIVEHLWKIIISDDSIDQYESNLMRRVCGLIYFPDKLCAEIKLKLLNNK